MNEWTIVNIYKVDFEAPEIVYKLIINNNTTWIEFSKENLNETQARYKREFKRKRLKDQI